MASVHGRWSFGIGTGNNTETQKDATSAIDVYVLIALKHHYMQWNVMTATSYIAVGVAQNVMVIWTMKTDCASTRLRPVGEQGFVVNAKIFTATTAWFTRRIVQMVLSRYIASVAVTIKSVTCVNSPMVGRV